jgi:hypothetical protein
MPLRAIAIAAMMPPCHYAIAAAASPLPLIAIIDYMLCHD